MCIWFLLYLYLSVRDGPQQKWGVSCKSGLTLKNGGLELQVGTCCPEVQISCIDDGKGKSKHPVGCTKVLNGLFWSNTWCRLTLDQERKCSNLGWCHGQWEQSILVCPAAWPIRERLECCGWPYSLSLSDFKAGAHMSFSLWFLLCFPTFLPRMSFSEEVDNPGTVKSSGSKSEDSIWSQKPLKKQVNYLSQWKNITKQKRDSEEAYVGMGKAIFFQAQQW